MAVSGLSDPIAAEIEALLREGEALRKERDRLDEAIFGKGSAEQQEFDAQNRKETTWTLACLDLLAVARLYPQRAAFEAVRSEPGNPAAQINERLGVLEAALRAAGRGLQSGVSPADVRNAVESRTRLLLAVYELLHDQHPTNATANPSEIQAMVGLSEEATDHTVLELWSDGLLWTNADRESIRLTPEGRKAAEAELLSRGEVHGGPQNERIKDRVARVFLSHGHTSAWMAVQAYIEKTLHIDTMALEQEPNLGRHVLTKLDQESRKCGYAVIVVTGDDTDAQGKARARENVMHEIGFFQGRFGLDRVCLLYERGTSIPSNIEGLVRIEFSKGNVKEAFGELTMELNAWRSAAGSSN